MNRLLLSDLDKSSTIHFIGIGGISMSGLAQVLKKRGFCVTGSDWKKTHITSKLEQLDITVYEGHRSENIGNADLVVYTAAAHGDNPEIQEAKQRHIRLIDRAECLGAIMKEYAHAVGVSGTHGKTTTTSMLAHALVHAHKDPTVSLGGELDILDGNIRIGQSDVFVTEACEYTNSFLKFFPSIALITNIEEDHLDFFSGIDEIIESFRSFAMLTKEHGYVVALGSDKNIQQALANSDLNICTYGLGSEFNYYARDLIYVGGFGQFDVMHDGTRICQVKLSVPGEHNVLNALATIAVCDLLGVDPQTAADGIGNFVGTHRRFEKKGTLNGGIIIDDYAHHPTEIIATLKAATAFEHNRIWCVFQPHTYTRTKTLWNDFVSAFDLADELILTDIYAAREMPDGVTSSENLAVDIAKHGVKCRYIETFDEIETLLKNEVKDGDMVFTMGAGNIIEIGENLVK